MPGGGANIAAAQVALPHSEFLDQSPHQNDLHQRPVRRRPVPRRLDLRQRQGDHATARSAPRRPRLPALLTATNSPTWSPTSNGQIDVVLDGHIDSIKGGIRNTFEAVPDAPVSKFTLEMQGGKKGLLQNSTNICKAPQKASVTFTGQNGKSTEASPLLKANCPKHATSTSATGWREGGGCVPVVGGWLSTGGPLEPVQVSGDFETRGYLRISPWNRGRLRSPFGGVMRAGWLARSGRGQVVLRLRRGAPP